MLPAPRTTAASTLVNQMISAPLNSTFEYASAASSAAPRPPMPPKMLRPKPSRASMNSAANAAEMNSACCARRLASSLRPAPSARATAAVVAPPMPPADICSISIDSGNTSAMPASASAPTSPRM
ncbi:hypothetical protein FQZ97_810010 [compost metagenome]